jgi:hypothetical protein
VETDQGKQIAGKGSEVCVRTYYGGSGFSQMLACFFLWFSVLHFSFAHFSFSDLYGKDIRQKKSERGKAASQLAGL